MDQPRLVERGRHLLPRRGQILVRDSVRSYGVATSSRRPPPDFLIAGTKKGGTTSLMNWLVQHPHVSRMFPPAQKLKSSHYFDINYHRGERWYRSHFPSASTRQRAERRAGGGPVVVGEASPYYMFHPAVPQRVRETMPGVKVIMLLREPVSRAYSNYWDRRAAGTEDLETFELALAAEPERMATVDQAALLGDPRYYSFHHDNHTYLARGRYVEHLHTWLNVFPRHQLLIIPAERMFKDPDAVFGEVERFLGIPAYTGLTLQPYNERHRSSMNAATRQSLTAYYRPHNTALYETLGEDLGWNDSYAEVDSGLDLGLDSALHSALSQRPDTRASQ